MTLNEIKGLTKFLNEEEVDKIKKEIKDKEQILKGGNLEEEELVEVLNTLFAILVIEKTLESEIEGVEEIKDELEEELVECYNAYDSYMAMSKKEDKKKKRRWLLDLLFISDNIHSKKENINISKKTLDRMQNELNNLKQQRSDENLRNVVNNRNGLSFEDFCKTPHECKHPHHHNDYFLQNVMNMRNAAILANVLAQRAEKPIVIKKVEKSSEKVDRGNIESKNTREIDKGKIKETPPKFRGRGM